MLLPWDLIYSTSLYLLSASRISSWAFSMVAAGVPVICSASVL